MQLCCSLHRIWIFFLFSQIQGLPPHTESKKASQYIIEARHSHRTPPPPKIHCPPLLVYKCIHRNQRNHWTHKSREFSIRDELVPPFSVLPSQFKQGDKRIILLNQQRDISISFPCWAMVLLISSLCAI